MYDELVKMFRVCAKLDTCIYCPYLATEACDNKAEKAADTIEELSKDRDNWKATAKEEREAYWHWFEQYQKDVPRWIPVTERLPDDRRDVQITVFWHDAWRTMYGYYDGAFWHLYAPMHTEVADVEVIGWMEKPAPMPLSAPPKEET